MSDTRIIKLANKHHSSWLELYKNYAEFYECKVTKKSLLQTWLWLNDNNHPLQGIVAEKDNVLIGFAHYRAMPSPLDGCDVGFLDDLFLLPENRGNKIGRLLIDRIKNDRKMVNEARNIRWIKIGDFVRGFDWPLEGPISGVYGSQRILNGIPKSPHFGIDISVPKRTPVLAPASGIISLADNLYYSGYTVILNHGLKVNSTFLHLDEIKVVVGDKVNRGDLIGFSGNSGRSTGPHLDWSIDWNGRRLDAAMLAGPME